MRKYDIFGKKLSQIKFVYVLAFVLLLGIVAYLSVFRYQSNQMDEIEKQRQQIQQEINQLLSVEEQKSIATIDELIPYLPRTYSQYIVNQELNYILNASGFEQVDDYRVSYNVDVPSPFQKTLPASLKYVRIAVNLTVSEPEKLLDYVDYLYSLDRLYVVLECSVSYTTEGAVAQIVFYTFYYPSNV